MARRDVSIIIPCFNKVDYTLRCLTSLSQHTPGDRYEVVLVDNASSDSTPELCAGLDGDVVVIRNETNLGFAAACNQGARAATGRHLLFLNNDTELLPGWFEPLVALLDAEPDVGAVGSKLLFPDGALQHAGVLTAQVEGGVDVSAVHEHYHKPADHPPANLRRDLDIVTAACVLIRREAFDAAGGFDEGYWNGYEDVDLCLSMRAAGWRIVYEPASVLYHHESVSGPERFTRVDANVERLQDRWRGRYTPEWLVTGTGVRRTHPGRARTEVVIAGPPVRPMALDHTVRAARRAIRPGDSVWIDPALSPPDAWLDDVVRLGRPDEAADGGADRPARFRLDLHPGVVIDRATLDALHQVAIVDDAVQAGPVLSDGAGAQCIDAWIDSAPRGATARRRMLGQEPGLVALVDVLDPRCVLTDRSPRLLGPPRTVVVRGAYAEAEGAPVGASR